MGQPLFFAVYRMRLLVILNFDVECGSEERTHPRKRGGEGDVEQEVRKVRFFIIAEQLRADDALDLGVKRGKSSSGTAAPSRKRECRRPP